MRRRREFILHLLELTIGHLVLSVCLSVCTHGQHASYPGEEEEEEEEEVSTTITNCPVLLLLLPLEFSSFAALPPCLVHAWTDGGRTKEWPLQLAVQVVADRCRLARWHAFVHFVQLLRFRKSTDLVRWREATQNCLEAVFALT